MTASEEELSAWWDTISDLPIWNTAWIEIPWNELPSDTQGTLKYLYQNVLFVNENAATPKILASVSPILRHIRRSSAIVEYIVKLEKRVDALQKQLGEAT